MLNLSFAVGFTRSGSRPKQSNARHHPPLKYVLLNRLLDEGPDRPLHGGPRHCGLRCSVVGNRSTGQRLPI